MPVDMNALRTITVVLDRGGYAVGNYDNSQAFIDSLRQDLTGMDVLNNAGQVIGAISSINPVTSIIGNTIALSITLPKVLNDGMTLGDALSIAGNVVAIVGAAVVVGAAANPFTVFGLTVLGASISLTQLKINEEQRSKAISEVIGTTPDPLVKVIRYIDPLIIDLDGDGLEITPLSTGIMFDADGDDIKTGTAWASADDGLLVWDRNANGLIDSGRELFGDETLLANGTKASHGFAALSELDGNADGKFNASDAQYANLRVWRDLNQDGISQTTELRTLADSSVKEIQVNSATTSENYGDAILVQNGHFVRADGSEGQVGSFILSQNNFVRSFPPIAVSQAAAAVMNIGGSGWVRDLQEAATQSPELIDLYNQARNAGTRTGFKEAVGNLLREWGNESSFNSASKQGLAAGYGIIQSEPLDQQERGWMDKAIKASDEDRATYRATLSTADRAKFDAMRERMVGGLENIHAYEAFTGHTFLSWSKVYGDAQNLFSYSAPSGRIPVEVWVPLSRIIAESRIAFMSSQPGYIRVDIPSPISGGIPHIESLWNRIVEDAASNLMAPLRLSKYLDMIDLTVTDAGISFDFNRMDAALAAATEANPQEGAALRLDLQQTYGSLLDSMGSNNTAQVRALVQRGSTDAAIREAFEASGATLLQAAATTGTDGKDAYAGDAQANAFNAGTGNDWLDGEAGNDALSGGAGDDQVFGGADNDALSGNDGSDTLDGGTGNDTLNGGLGNNTYLFGKGDGQDLITTTNDGTAGKLNTLQFKAGVAPSEIELKPVYDTDWGGSWRNWALEVSIVGTTDKVTINSFFQSDDPTNSHNGVQQFKFADGTTWDLATIQAKLFSGTANGDTLVGTPNADTISGSAGNDNLSGRDGHDMLNGGADNDNLSGETGNDTLDGGTGNDTLNGGLGNNTYLFGKGDGQDLITTTNDGTAGKLNTLQFKAGVAPSEIELKPVYDTDWGGSWRNWALEVSIVGTTDKVTINSFFQSDDPTNSHNGVQQFKFADGTTWDLATIQAKLFSGTANGDTLVGTPNADTISGSAGNDNLSGRDGHDMLNGGADNDNLSGETGNDTLDGGTGNDTLNGGLGNNTYLFGKGDGQDLITTTNDGTAGKLNTLQFKAGVAPSEIELKPVYDTDWGGSWRNWALEVSIVGTTDKVTINSFFQSDDPTNSHNGVQQFKFADGTTWDLATIQAKLFSGTANGDTLVGTPNADTISGSAGNDNLSGRDGHDMLNGGADNDNLSGETGNDTLDGGTGNDTLNGGLGNNTYLFGKGDGQDLITTTNDGTAGKLNTLQFKAGVAPSEIELKPVYDTDWGGSWRNWALEVSIVGTTDKVTINSFFQSDDPTNSHNGVQQFKFADGTTWDLATIQAKLFSGTANGDTLVGTPNADTISGSAGNDNLSGRDGHDMLNGGADNDNLSGETGNDTLDGGTGNDTLNGGLGNNTYLFGKGDGQDLITTTNDGTAGKLNTLQFKAGVAPSEIELKPVYDTDWGGSWRNWALEVSIVGTTDKVTINSFFQSDDPTNSHNGVQQFKFADGTTWDLATIQAKLFSGTANGDTLVGTPNADTISGSAGNDNLSGRDGHDMLNGGADNDNLSGETGNDTLDGGTGNDTLNGGLGNNTYLFGKGDGQDLITTTNDGTAGKLNTLQFKAGVAPSEIELKPVYDTDWGGSWRNWALEVSIVGTTDKVTINSFFQSDDPTNSHNGVQQFKFADGTTWDLATITQRTLNPQNQAPIVAVTIADQATSENLGWTYQVPSDSFSDPEGKAMTYSATRGDGAPLPSWLTFNADTRTFSGTPPLGSAGNLDLKVVAKDIGGLSISSTFTLSLSPPAGQTLTGTAANNTLQGDSGHDTLNGLAGNDTLNGGAGADAMFGGLGDDTYVVDDAADVVTENANEGTDLVQSSVTHALAANVENLTLTGTAAIHASGNAAANNLKGNTAANVLDGGAGADTMAGGTGDDTYIVDNAGDVVTEGSSAGVDSVQSSITYTLTTNVENLTLTGNAAINATGTGAANVLNGNAGDNVINGAAGADTMAGGVGNDTYVVDNTADVVTENANEGLDIVQSSVTYTLAANVENLTLTGTTTINATGNAGANVLTGNTGANVLNGGAGADTMAGGAGNDTYVVDDVTDTVTENANEGTDLVQSSITYALGAHLENLTLTGADAVNATGNAAANNLKGNTAANVLDGGVGADTMAGSTGDDTYIVDDVADVVTEGSNGGTDTVRSSVTYTLATNVENIALTGTAAINATGNTLANVLTGNAAANVLDGAAGSDTMAGGAGNDTYVVGNTGDVVTEGVGEGTDLVQSSITYTLSANVENLTLTGTTAINATGNDASNVLTGNTAVNTLTGGAGNDTLVGGVGADKLFGGTGNDTYVLGRGDGADVVTEDDSTAGNTDVALFGASIATDQLWFRQSGNNLEVSVIGTSDKMTLNNWYLGNQYHVEQFKTSDGKVLLDSQVQNLVQAMAGFSPPAAGQETLPPAYATSLQPVIAANWQ